MKPGLAYWEVAHSLYFVLGEKQWPKGELISAARKAEVIQSGWPIGIVQGRDDASPKPRKFGISVSIRGYANDDLFDYWELHENGRFYLLRTIEESILNYEGKPIEGRLLYFDIRIARTIESLLHCQRLYEALKIDPKQAIHFHSNYFGLKERILVGAERGRSLSLKYKSEEDTHEFSKVCSIDLIKSDLKGMVYEMTKSLFELFGWYDYSKVVCDGIIDKFCKMYKMAPA